MNEIIIYRIIIGFFIVGILWLYFKRNKINQVDDSVVKEKEKEIAVLETEKSGLQENVNILKDSLKSEKETTTKQLEAINKIDVHKSAISKYTLTTEERNK